MTKEAELEFWRKCCQCGISICQIPKPMREFELVWLVQKNKTFFDRNTWQAAHTFDTLEDVYLHVERYLESGREPRAVAE
jgi:hypothetical protein